eukprot:Seg1762.3 transcript_id=Seg1762.3/GoldUCD/mRNA.D3Y31 product="Dedicator of cytokinesis protein 7" protein_id=Seg1762.3/GoldUCD/D3Y31
MARNCEKHFVGLNRVFLEEQWKKDKEKKRPHLNALNTVAAVKEWIPSIKKEMNYCLQQLSGVRKHDYADSKIKEFEERVQYLEREHKRFVRKVFQLDPTTKGVPWEARPYTRKRKQETTIDGKIEERTFKKKPIEICQSLLEDKNDVSDDDDDNVYGNEVNKTTFRNTSPKANDTANTLLMADSNDYRMERANEASSSTSSSYTLVEYESSDSDATMNQILIHSDTSKLLLIHMSKIAKEHILTIGQLSTEIFGLKRMDFDDITISAVCYTDENGEQDDKKSAAEKAYNDMPRGSWASSIFDLQTSQPDELLSGILESIPQEDIDQQNENERKKDRVHQLFSVYIPNEEEESFVKKAPAIIPHEHFGQRILIKCIELRLDLDVEPMFAVMALYDGKAKRKISENFHFDMNKDWHKKMISPFMGKQDISSLARSCIFSVTYPSSEVFLVIKLEKALQQGDISECAEPYTKDAESSKNKDKAKSNAEQFCEKYGGFRMPFAWTAIHLIDVISGATAGGDSGSQAEKENTLTREGSARRNTDEMDGRASIKRGDSVSRRTSNSAEIGKPNTSRFDRPRSGEEDEPMNISNFRAITLNVSTFFKQESERLTDEDLFKFLADLRRPSSLLRRLKCIPG